MINKLVSVKNVIINIMDDLALDHSKYTPMFTNWALTAEKKIGGYYQYVKKHAVLDIHGCHAELPCDAVYLQRAIMGDLGDCCTDIFERTCGVLGNFNVDATAGNINLSSFLIVDLGANADGTTAITGFVRYEVQDNKIIFLDNYDGQKVTIQYLGMQTDCNGIPDVGENHIEAIGEYCLWRYRRRSIKSGIDIGVVRDHKKEWEQLCACARADDAWLSDSERTMIVELLHDPFAGKGLWLGMNTTTGNYYI